MPISKAYEMSSSILSEARKEIDAFAIQYSQSTYEQEYAIHVTMILLVGKIKNYLKTNSTGMFKERFLID